MTRAERLCVQLAAFLTATILIVGLHAALAAAAPKIGASFGQTATGHTVTFTITGAASMTLYKSTAANDAGKGESCSGASSFVSIATVTSAGYTDSGLANGETRCYWGLTAGNVPTNELEVVAPTAGTVVVKQGAQDLTALVQ